MEGDFCFSIVETLPLCFPWGHVHNVTPPKEHQRRALKNRPWWENGLQTKQQHEEMTRPAVTTDPSGKLRVLTEDGDWVLIHPATSTSFPPSLLLPSLCIFSPYLTCLGSQSRDSLIHFSPVSQKYLYRSRFLSYNDDVQFLCLLLLLRIIGVHRFPTSNPTAQTAFPGCWDSAEPETAVNHPISQAPRSYLKLPQGLFPG